jgi:hypothetical protein
MKNSPANTEAPGIRVPDRRRPAAGWEAGTGIIGIEIEIGTGLDSDTNGWHSLHDQILTIIRMISLSQLPPLWLTDYPQNGIHG